MGCLQGATDQRLLLLGGLNVVPRVELGGVMDWESLRSLTIFTILLIAGSNIHDRWQRHKFRRERERWLRGEDN